VGVSVGVGSGVGVSVGVGVGIGESISTDTGDELSTASRAGKVLTILGVFVGVGVTRSLEMGPQAKAGIMRVSRIIGLKN
jgi:hypothetical protein